MGRGLGTMQRRILEALEPARQEVPIYTGAGLVALWRRDNGERGWVRCHGKHYQLADGVYDLRCALRYCADQDGAVRYGEVSGAYRASFIRSVRTLIGRGVLVRCFPVPAQAYWDWTLANRNGVAYRRYKWDAPLRRKPTVFYPGEEQTRFVSVSATYKDVALRQESSP